MTSSPHRVVPPDTVILEWLRAGRTLLEIAEHHGVSAHTLRAYAVKHNLLERAAMAAPATLIQETAAKVVRWRNTLTPGRDGRVVEIAVSLPRIPTLHGHYVAACLSTAAAQGA